MPKTIITAADGTTYLEVGAARRRFRRTLLLIVGAMILPFVLAAITGIAIGADRIITGDNARNADNSQVRNYNDGFIDSKKDDCAQGSQFACNWLKKVNR